ncbi:MAG: hypothetical protein ACR652_21165 [Methylocystis sp.]|uniref:hypothetical protein n=1 Tax=Methylocystis sp. TaxID=1911079 RepID=UPI003DA3E03B
MKIELLMTVEQPVIFPIGADFKPAVNGIARAWAYETAHTDDEEAGVSKTVWKFPVGSIVDIPDKAANTLIDLSYARAV